MLHSVYLTRSNLLFACFIFNFQLLIFFAVFFSVFLGFSLAPLTFGSITCRNYCCKYMKNKYILFTFCFVLHSRDAPPSKSATPLSICVDLFEGGFACLCVCVFCCCLYLCEFDVSRRFASARRKKQTNRSRLPFFRILRACAHTIKFKTKNNNLRLKIILNNRINKKELSAMVKTKYFRNICRASQTLRALSAVLVSVRGRSQRERTHTTKPRARAVLPSFSLIFSFLWNFVFRKNGNQIVVCVCTVL